MKSKLPLTTARVVFTAAILLLNILGFLNRWLVCRYSIWTALLQFSLPLLVGAGIYHLEYHHRFLEKIFLFLKQGRVYWVILPLVSGSFGVLLHHQDPFLGLYFPLCFLLSVCAAEAESHDSFQQLLSAVLLQIPVFLGLSLYLCYNAASAVAIVVISYVVLFRILAWHTHCEKAFWTACLAMTGIILLTGACIPKVLDRLLYLAVNQNDFNIYVACSELFQTGKWFGPAAFSLSHASDLFLTYDLGYLAARFGFISVVPILSVTSIMLISGCILCTGFRRPMTTLAIGAQILILLRVLSYLAKSISITVGLGAGLPFFSGGIAEQTVDVLLAVIVLQPLNPKPLLQLTKNDPDFLCQQLGALLMLPRNKEGAAQLAHYIYNTENYVAWTVLARYFLQFFCLNDRRILLTNAADLFHTQEHLRKTHPEFYLISGQEDITVSEELKTACHDNTFIDAAYTYESEGTTLLRYWGSRDILCIPPFFRRLGDQAFFQKEVEIVSVPGIVEKIGTSCFRNCRKLHTVELRKGLEEIGAFCFCQCSSLEHLDLPATLTTIENDAFAGSGLAEIKVPASVTVISPYTFAGTPLKKATLLGVTRIEEGAFKDCTLLETLFLPDSLAYIAPNAFHGCSETLEIIASPEWKALHPDLIRRITEACKKTAHQEVTP